MIRRTFLKSLLGTAVAIPGARAADQPSRGTIVLQHSPLAGFQYHAGEALWPGLAAGDSLDLLREPANPHDDRAVAVRWRGLKLGYLPRTDNCTVAQLLDRGESITARILRLNHSRNPWQRITLEVSLANAG